MRGLDMDGRWYYVSPWLGLRWRSCLWLRLLGLLLLDWHLLERHGTILLLSARPLGWSGSRSLTTLVANWDGERLFKRHVAPSLGVLLPRSC